LIAKDEEKGGVGGSGSDSEGNKTTKTVALDPSIYFQVASNLSNLQQGGELVFLSSSGIYYRVIKIGNIIRIYGTNGTLETLFMNPVVRLVGSGNFYNSAMLVNSNYPAFSNSFWKSQAPWMIFSLGLSTGIDISAGISSNRYCCPIRRIIC
jgi:hypothetical protein